MTISAAKVDHHQKEEILCSDEWQRWINDESGAAVRWRGINTMRSKHPHDPLQAFAVDRQVRFLVAEFIRRNHHRRATDVIAQHHDALGRLDYGDVVLRTTISNVCVAHGLDRTELEDRERFPQRREIRGESVNVQFLAALLRIGDLLDMRCDRACSLLLSAACPLPPDSYAHWSQYNRITHELVAPDCIELRAECLNQEEHRFLFDWCKWLVDEVNSVTVMMANAPRHNGWRGPRISIGDGSARETIVIRPAPGASYLPHKWQFELDANAVFERLVRDVYGEPQAFVRELIQNALDAMRCQMYVALRADGLACPEYPTDVPSERLTQYELRISLELETVKNPLSGEEEVCQVLVVDDCGIGMDQEIIERYFLQVGRSYYTSDSFRRTFPFHPVSRFGVGFLSVFAESDHVRVETLRTYGSPDANPIALTLTGPRSYLLSERGTRSTPGTRIAVRLRQVLPHGHLTKLVRNWCRRVEFAVQVRECGSEETILADRPDDWVCEMSHPANPEAQLVVRALPVDLPGVRGELYVIAKVTSAGESWVDGFPIHQLREQYPFSELPSIPKCYVCQQGTLREKCRPHRWNFAHRIDDRRRVAYDVLDHNQRSPRRTAVGNMLDDAWWLAITDHLTRRGNAMEPDGWRYVHRLAAGLDASWWPRVPNAIPVWTTGTLSLLSVESMAGLETFTSINGVGRRDAKFQWNFSLDSASRAAIADVTGPVLLSEDIDSFNAQFCEPLFAGRRASKVEWLTPTSLSLTWTRSDEMQDTCEFRDLSIIGIRAHSRSQRGYGDRLLLNSNHPLVQWTRWAVRESVPGASRFWEYLGDIHFSKFNELQQMLGQYLAPRQFERLPPRLEITKASFLSLLEEGLRDTPAVRLRHRDCSIVDEASG